MLKLSLLCAASTLAIASVAQAQEGNRPFSGFYAGVHGGLRNDRLTGEGSLQGFLDRYGSTLAVSNSHAGIYGGQIGYNYVSPKGALAGVELSASAGESTDSQSRTEFGRINRGMDYRRTVSGLALAQGKLGWAGDRVALYGLGGYAFSRGKISGVADNEGPVTYFSGKTNFSGWTAGVGADLKLTDNVSIGAAYNYVSLTGDPLKQNGVAIDQDLTSHIAKMVLNFHF